MRTAHLLPSCLLLCLACPLLAQQATPAAKAPGTLSQEAFNPQDYLAATRWTDGCYGVSLAEPKDMRRSATLAQWLSQEGGAQYSLTVNFLLPPPRGNGQAPQALSLKDSSLGVMANLITGQGLAVPLPEFTRDFLANKHPCTVSYSLLQPQTRHTGLATDSFLVGVGVLQVTPYNHLVLRLMARIPAGTQGELPFLVEAQRKMEAMLQSVRTTPESTLRTLREAQLARGGAALKTFTSGRIRQAMPAQQYLRVIQEGKDAGWLRMGFRQQDKAWYAAHPPRANAVDALGQPGLLMEVQSHSRSTQPGDNETVDVAQTFFKSDDSNYEAWERTTTWRSGSGQKQSHTETGFLLPPKGGNGIADLRVMWAGSTPPNLSQFFGTNPSWRQKMDEKWDRLERTVNTAQRQSQAARDPDALVHGNTIAAERDNGKNQQGDVYRAQWDMPLGQAYLPQAYAWLMPWLLPTQSAQSYLCAFYSPEAKQPGFCLFKVLPKPDGSRQVTFRPALDQSEQLFHFGADGKLQSAQLPDGTTLIPTSAEELAKIWKNGNQ